MDYWNKVMPLEHRALITVIQTICQDRSFKEAVLSFGDLNLQKELYYMADEEREEIRQHFNSSPADRYAAFTRIKYKRYERRLNHWMKMIEECIQSILKNSKELPEHLKDEAKEWISRHVYEYLSYCRRMEVLTGLPRYFFVDFVTKQDWNTEGSLDEKVLAERLIEDGRLIVLQRYRVACTYCLTRQRLRLWKQLTPEERDSLNQGDDPLFTFENNRAVLLWSYHMKGGTQFINVNGESDPWMAAAEIAVYDGNIHALRESWENLRFRRQGAEASDLAIRCFNQWKICLASKWKRKLLSLDWYSGPWSFSDFRLPIHYARMISLFFKIMDEDELEIFFREILTQRKDLEILNYFLDWPNVDYFLPTIRFLRGFLPDEDLEMVYLWSLLNLASRIQTQQPLPRYPNKTITYYLCDYRSILRLLWDETPVKYKRYAFNDTLGSFISKDYRFLILLLEKNPFREEDERLFMRVFRDATAREKKAFLMSYQWNKVYATLVLRENWSLLDWLTRNSFDEDENEVFRRWYIQSNFGKGLCFNLLLENKEKVLNDLICWSLKSVDERKRLKSSIIHKLSFIDQCLSLITEKKFQVVERIMNFCLESGEIQDFKKRLANEDVFYSLILNHEWSTLDKYVAWCFETDEEIADFKKGYFSADGVDLFFHFVFEENLNDVQRFYQWFGLSQKEIEQLTKDTVFSLQSVDYLLGLLYSWEPLPVVLLLWCLKDKEMIFELKSSLERHLLDGSRETNMAKHKLHCLIELLLTLKGLRHTHLTF